jgi:hypothetical protein
MTLENLDAQFRGWPAGKIVARATEITISNDVTRM